MDALQRPRKVIDSVYAALRDSICDGDLKPGQRLRQDEIADSLGVSRQPVGQALILLKAEGLVTESGRQGVVVSDLDPAAVRDIYGIRSALDSLAAGLAAQNPDPARLQPARAVLAQGHAALERSASVAELVKLDMRFHQAIYRLSGNVLVDPTLASHWHHLRRVMAGVVEAGGYRERLWEEHEAILEAIASGDGPRAAELSRAHVELASEALRNKIESAG